MRVSVSLCFIAVGVVDAFTVGPLHGASRIVASNTALSTGNSKLNLSSSGTGNQPIQKVRTFLEDSGITKGASILYQPIQQAGKFVEDTGTSIKESKFYEPIRQAEEFLEDTGIIMKASRFIIRVANHLPAMASLYYFGLISMASMMPGATAMPKPNLMSVLTANVGPTTNGQFSAFFPTLVTPPSFIFLVWPLIAAVQVFSLTVSSLLGDPPILDQGNLSALSLSNLAAAAWLFASSRASEGMLPLGSTLILPLVPFFASYPLRRTSAVKANRFKLNKIVFQLFSGFTTLASFLAFAVELQHGGRIPFFTGRPELCAGVFLGLYQMTALRGGSITKRFVNAAAISGIVAKRIVEGAGVSALLLSPSFYGALYVAYTALLKLSAS
mmetsp:Transcript_42907/g.63658  ORF Transcript_42907/g.63658 Transcript_42907/m.63658 type:complete len:385 (-) Transcript_42907:444-1598(-)